jgi:hypothetical protein
MSHVPSRVVENSDRSGGAVPGIRGRASSQTMKVDGTVVPSSFVDCVSHHHMEHVFVSVTFNAHVFMVPENFS